MDVLSVGFFGKLPAVGDFVRRRVDDAVVDTWDAWLQGAMASSRDALGDRWLDLYLTAPMWRFFASPGVLDELPRPQLPEVREGINHDTWTVGGPKARVHKGWRAVAGWVEA